MGIPIFAPYLTDGNPIDGRFGKFYVKAFELPHNGTVNYGFYIQVDGQKILYMTDYEFCRYNFSKLEINHLLVECNYQKELVNKDLANYEHKIRGHSSLDYCKQFLSDNITKRARNVILVHLGTGTTKPEECIAEVKKVAGNANVGIAEKGKSFNLDECPF
jgi:ribonuclease BN (tRNA processing enzyme)